MSKKDVRISELAAQVRYMENRLKMDTVRFCDAYNDLDRLETEVDRLEKERDKLHLRISELEGQIGNLIRFIV